MPQVKIDGFSCSRCSHIWAKRKTGRPIICPRCKSPYWDTQRREARQMAENRATYTTDPLDASVEH